MIITVKAELTLQFDTDEIPWIRTFDDAEQEMIDYLLTGPHADEFDIEVS